MIKETMFAIFILGVLTVSIFGVVYNMPSPCIPVSGIDHNGKEEPFTVYLGGCDD